MCIINVCDTSPVCALCTSEHHGSRGDTHWWWSCCYLQGLMSLFVQITEPPECQALRPKRKWIVVLVQFFCKVFHRHITEILKCFVKSGGECLFWIQKWGTVGARVLDQKATKHAIRDHKRLFVPFEQDNEFSVTSMSMTIVSGGDQRDQKPRKRWWDVLISWEDSAKEKWIFKKDWMLILSHCNCPWTNSREWKVMLPHSHEKIPWILSEARTFETRNSAPSSCCSDMATFLCSSTGNALNRRMHETLLSFSFWRLICKCFFDLVHWASSLHLSLCGFRLSAQHLCNHIQWQDTSWLIPWVFTVADGWFNQGWQSGQVSSLCQPKRFFQTATAGQGHPMNLKKIRENA